MLLLPITHYNKSDNIFFIDVLYLLHKCFDKILILLGNLILVQFKKAFFPVLTVISSCSKGCLGRLRGTEGKGGP